MKRPDQQSQPERPEQAKYNPPIVTGQCAQVLGLIELDLDRGDA